MPFFPTSSPHTHTSSTHTHLINIRSSALTSACAKLMPTLSCTTHVRVCWVFPSQTIHTWATSSTCSTPSCNSGPPPLRGRCANTTVQACSLAVLWQVACVFNRCYVVVPFCFVFHRKLVVMHEYFGNLHGCRVIFGPHFVMIHNSHNRLTFRSR